MINYYFMMDCIKELDSSVTSALPSDKSIYFNVSNFSSVSVYSFVYNLFKKDKYDLETKIRDHYKDFIVEATINLKANMPDNDSFFIEGLLLLYGLITTNTLSIFPTAYTYYDSFENLIRNPMVKCFYFMGTNSYYSKSYKRFYKFAKNSNKQGKKWDYKIFDKIFARKKEKKEYLIYTKDEDSSLLNLKKEAYMVNGIEHRNTFDELLKKAKASAIKKINALNSYLFLQKKDNDFRIEFNIPQDKKL